MAKPPQNFIDTSFSHISPKREQTGDPEKLADLLAEINQLGQAGLAESGLLALLADGDFFAGGHRRAHGRCRE
jgi:hypothetical protein